MIIGTSHISYSSYEIEKDVQKYIAKGYSLKFLEKDIDNSIQKKLFLNRYSSKHSLAVLSGKNGFNLELVEHHPLKKTDLEPNNNIMINFCDGYIESVEYRVKNFDLSVLFWEELLGFSIIETDKSICSLEKKTVIPQWGSKVKLHKTRRNISTPKLDAKGATSFAFLSTNLSSDLFKMHQSSHVVCGEPFKLEVNGNVLNIAFIQGPSQELIELIELENE